MQMMGQLHPQLVDSEFHKRFKQSEAEEVNAAPADSIKINQKIDTNSESESEFSQQNISDDSLSFSEEEVGVEKTEKWLRQNDILNCVHSISGRDSSILNDIDKSFSSEIKQDSIDEIIGKPAKNRLVLARKNNENEFFGAVFGETAGNLFSNASFLTLTIVMCLILCL